MGEAFLTGGWLWAYLALGFAVALLYLRRLRGANPTLRRRIFTASASGVAVMAALTWATVSYRGLPVPVAITLFVAVVLAWLLNNTSWGRHVYAVGGNRVASRVAGIRVGRQLLLGYVLIGTLTALAAMLFVGRLGSAPPEAGLFLELNAIAAVVIGGASLYGGSGTVPGVLLGALLMQSLSNGSVSPERAERLSEHHQRWGAHTGSVPRLRFQARRTAVYTAMTLRERLYFLAAGTIACTAYVAALCRRSGLVLYDSVATTRGWQTLEFASLRVRVPPDWGDVERTPDGGYVVHNQPVKDRIDGDTVWYASAIELRVRQPDMPGLPRLAPMEEATRRLETADGPVLVALQIANGVGSSRRREAHRVLRSARAMTRRP